MPVAIATFGIHTLVILILQIVYRDVVAIDSIMAMTIRMIVWIIILTLIFFQSQKNKVTTVLKHI